MAEHLVVLTTVGSEEDGARLARALLERGVVACVNVVSSVRSLYRWKGSIEDEREHLLVMKTRGDRYDALEAAVQELHPYEVPELLAISVERGAPPYLAWIDESVPKTQP